MGPPRQREKSASPGGRVLTLAFISILEERPDSNPSGSAPKSITTPLWLELGECSVSPSHSGTWPLFYHAPSFSQEVSTSPSAASWQMEKGEAARGSVGAGLEVLDPISALVSWP